MRIPIFLSVLLFFTPLFAVVHNEHTLTADKESKILPDSKELHAKIGKPGYYEKRYATITFSNKTGDEAHLKTIKLRWNGPAIKGIKVKGTLFNKLTEERLPVHDNQIASSTWNEREQCMIFTLPQPLALSGTTKLSIVLTVNPELEKALQRGTFSLVDSSLPESFRTPSISPAQ